MSSVKPDLRTEISGLKLQNPIFLGAGPLGYTGQSLRKYAEAGFGAVVGKTTTPQPRKGNPTPRIIDCNDCCMINAEGLPNMGYEAFKKEIKGVKGTSSAVICSIHAESIEDFIEMTTGFEKEGADGLELDVGCPHTKETYGARESLQSLEGLSEIIRAVKKKVKIPVWVKISSPNMEPTDIVETAKTVEKAGADAVTPFTAIPGLPIDVNTGKPRLGLKTGIGSITGPAIKYAGIKRAADVARNVRIPVIGTGGISNGLDVIEYLMAGASAVEVYTMVHREGPSIFKRMLGEVEEFMTKNGYTSISQMIGITLKYIT